MDRIIYTLEDGMINVRDPVQIAGRRPNEKQIIFREASDILNIDIDDNGKGSLRNGTSAVALGAYRCGWSNPTRTVALVMYGGSLCRFDGSATPVLRSGLSSTRDMVYEEGRAIYGNGTEGDYTVIAYTNGQVYGIIKAGVDLTLVPDSRNYKKSMPPGQCLCYAGGRMYVAAGATIEASMPYDPETRDNRLSTIPLDKYVTMIRAVDDGIYVSTLDRVYWNAGLDLTEKTMVQLESTNQPCIPGMSETDRAESFGLDNATGKVAVWAGKDGFCIGMNGGRVINVSSDRVSYGPGAKGALLIRDKNGYKQVLGVMKNPGDALNKFVSRTITVT